MADVVGYSRLMQVDEPGTLDAFNRHLEGYIRPSIREYNGRLVKTMGDGLIASFDSPVNAVRCAIAMQEGAVRCNDEVPAGRKMRFRIGMNLGDIVIEKGDVFGDAVNVAARLENLAEPDAIVVSDAVVQHLTGKLPALLEDMGEHQVKNISRPIHAWRVKAERTPRAQDPAASDEPSTPAIAVLPFLNVSGDPEQSYFSDGMTEDVITELARFRTLSVIARTSSFVYRDRPADVKQVGEELGVQFVVEGSVRKLDDRVRITVQLINAVSRHHVWAERYDAPLTDLFSVQDEITRKIVGTIVPRIEAEELEVARRKPTGHTRAYDAYLRGKAHYYASDDAENRAEARKNFETAIALDPDFARAYCYLAAIDNNATIYQAAGTPLEPLRERARQFALKAVALDDSDPLTHLSVAWSHLWRGEFDAARRHLDRATELNPNDADTAIDRGTTLMYLGDPAAAIEVMTAGMRLNPFHPDSYRADLAEVYFSARRYQDMLSLAEQLPERSAKFVAWKAAGFAYAGKQVQARKSAREFVSRVRAIWAGDPAASEPEYVAWLLSFSPFRRREDVEHLLRGLALSGLEVPGGQAFDQTGHESGR